MAVKINRGGGDLDAIKGVVITPRTTIPFSQGKTFRFVGGPQFFTVPAGITQIHVTQAGASGGNSAADGSKGGMGRIIYGVIDVTPGEVLQINNGGSGEPDGLGWNGGGTGGAFRGGGGTDIRRAPYALADRLMVAGAGAGVQNGYPAGNAGAPIGQAGSGTHYPGAGGTTVAGGVSGGQGATDGALGQGGNGGGSYTNGGGGGGYYGGGGGGSNSGNLGTGTGGGGSSLIPLGGSYGDLWYGHGYTILRWGGSLNNASPFRTWYQDAEPVAPAEGDFWFPRTPPLVPTFIGATTQTTIASPFTVAKPPGAQTGDLLILAAATRVGLIGGVTTWDAATLISAGDDTTLPGRQVWTRRVQAGDGATYPFTHGASGNNIGLVLLCYRNVGFYTPALATGAGGLWTPANGMVVPEITPLQGGARIVSIFAGNSGNNLAPPTAAVSAPYTLRASASLDRPGIIVYDALANNGTKPTNLGGAVSGITNIDYGMNLVLYPPQSTGLPAQRFNGLAWQPFTIGA